jgi:hypothetical protein
MDVQENGFMGACDACGATKGSLVKMSLGKDFFGRAYDRLSPSFDQSPKWYCETCSMHKNLQRDFRDIRHEFDKLNAGQMSELLTSDQVQRAFLRLREIIALIDGPVGSSPLVNVGDVNQLLQHIQRMQRQPGFPSLAG